MATRLRQANLKPKKEEATVNKKLKTIDHSMKTITVSKDFLQKAGQFGTPEFRDSLEAEPPTFEQKSAPQQNM